MKNLKINWLVKDEDFDKHFEKGICDGLKVRDGKKVKEIVGYFEDENEEEDAEIIAYISCDGDIEDNYDLLDDFFYSELREKHEKLVKSGVIEEWVDEDEE
jgi:hypothetical protein